MSVLVKLELRKNRFRWAIVCVLKNWTLPFPIRLHFVVPFLFSDFVIRRLASINYKVHIFFSFFFFQGVSIFLVLSYFRRQILILFCFFNMVYISFRLLLLLLLRVNIEFFHQDI